MRAFGCGRPRRSPLSAHRQRRHLPHPLAGAQPGRPHLPRLGGRPYAAMWTMGQRRRARADVRALRWCARRHRPPAIPPPCPPRSIQKPPTPRPSNRSRPGSRRRLSRSGRPARGRGRRDGTPARRRGGRRPAPRARMGCPVSATALSRSRPRRPPSTRTSTADHPALRPLTPPAPGRSSGHATPARRAARRSVLGSVPRRLRGCGGGGVFCQGALDRVADGGGAALAAELGEGHRDSAAGQRSTTRGSAGRPRRPCGTAPPWS